MNSSEIRKKFLDFFKKKGHKIRPPSSLVPNDSSVLFTTAGMQQFKPYYLGEKSPFGDRVCSIQKCFRTSDLDSIGDESHLSFFEMLGNFSFGGYFKKEAIEYAYEFITKEVGLKIDYVSVFAGDSRIKLGQRISSDIESEEIWKEIRNKKRENFEIKRCGREDNFWGPTGDKGPCGPTTEIYVNGIEIWNIVFNEYYGEEQNENWLVKDWNKIMAGKGHRNLKLTKLKIPGVDTGMGLERLAMVSQNKNNVFETDLFKSVMQKLDEISPKGDLRSKRIVADHIRAARFLLTDGVELSNTGRGYVLRRILRKAIYYADTLGLKQQGTTDTAVLSHMSEIAELFTVKYMKFYPELKTRADFIMEEWEKEENKFRNALQRGKNELLKIFDKAELFEEDPRKVEIRDFGDYQRLGKKFFEVFSTYGYPIELSIEVINNLKKELGFEQLSKTQKEKIEKEFQKEFETHQELSRTASAGMFKSGLADNSEMATKYHTATHLLLAALRKVLGEHVFQKGSNITAERMRLDFSHSEKMTTEEIKKVEDIVNEKIKENLAVKMEEMSLEEAKKQGAMGVFESKYGENVKVYSIDNFSQEICAGPHVERTGVLGKFKIVKEEASSAGVRRIKAVLE